MKKLTIGGLLVLALSSCHSTTEADIISEDSTLIKSIDTVSVINDSIDVVVDTLKK